MGAKSPLRGCFVWPPGNGPKVGIRILGSNQLRFRDAIDLKGARLIESKNVAYQGYTRQLRDYAAYANYKEFTFELYVRGPLHPSGQTILSGPLEAAIRSGIIKPKFIPGTF
ncbi:putative toxin [Sphingomonas sp. 1P06PA]|uniref:putative toxin n=1 Tax=Sphingomonas sp. 1P06PA TaxID=554121 RepID=UPI0039A6BAD3